MIEPAARAGSRCLAKIVSQQTATCVVAIREGQKTHLLDKTIQVMDRCLGSLLIDALAALENSVFKTSRNR